MRVDEDNVGEAHTYLVTAQMTEGVPGHHTASRRAGADKYVSKLDASAAASNLYEYILRLCIIFSALALLWRTVTDK